jgi:CRISPR-associated protein (TIGR02710 family)
MRPLLTAWRRYAYDEAAAGLGGLFRPRNPELSARLNRARDLSTAFAAWDRFDHPEALQLMEIYAPALGQVLSPYIGVLKALTSADSAKRSAFQILDLWRNAERRAVQGRYDDAIARGYRLTEWAAQWILQRRAGIDTADVDPARIPAGMMLSPSRTGKRQAGLYAAWQMVDALTDGPGAQFFRAQGKELLDHLHSRNSSILAHGFTPLGREQWSSFATWLEQHLLLAFIAEAGPSIVRSMPPQLPDRCPHG